MLYGHLIQLLAPALEGSPSCLLSYLLASIWLKYFRISQRYLHLGNWPVPTISNQKLNRSKGLQPNGIFFFTMKVIKQWTVCPERCSMPHPWKKSGFCWMELWATWCGCRSPWSLQGIGQDDFEGSFKPKPFYISSVAFLYYYREQQNRKWKVMVVLNVFARTTCGGVHSVFPIK